MDSVSIVIPCYNPRSFLLEAIASARAQSCGPVEIILVNDGTTSPEGLALLETAARSVERYIEQPNRGLAAARNVGFCAATSQFVVPLDADDMLDPEYTGVCLATATQHPEAAFIYTDYRVFGTQAYLEQAPEYNLYRLLDRNTLTYAALIRRAHWHAVGGYDEAMTGGYEDWEFWLRMGCQGRFGRHAAGALFWYRKHGPSLLDEARRHHEEIVEYIRSKHAGMYSPTGRRALKACWEASVCIMGSAVEQTLGDCSFIRKPSEAPPNTPAFLVPASSNRLDPHDGEYAALAVWGGRSPLRLPDGSVACSREQFFRGAAPEAAPGPRFATPGPFEALRRHLANAELLSPKPWLSHPVRSALRLVPLRLKEHINRTTGRAVFDLSFYLQFQPGSAVLGGSVLEPLDYFPKPDTTRRCVVLVTPHLGPGGAETVLLEITAALDRCDFEILLLAAQSRDNRWASRWKAAVDHVYDLSALVVPERLPGAIYSVIANWKPAAVLIQNSLAAYAVIPHLRQKLPDTRLLDLVHSVDEHWDILAATAAVAGDLDLRVAVSETVRQRLIAAGTPAAKTRVTLNGIDLPRFGGGPPLREAKPYRVLFAGRLDPVKRPLLLPEIARELHRLRPDGDFSFVVAGDGSEGSALASKVRRAGLTASFEFHGQVPEIAPLLADCDLLLLPSRAEGMPLVILEAFASARPVVASAVGAIPEIVSELTGVLVPHGEGEAAAFAAAIDTLLRDPVRRRAMGQRGRALVQAEYSREAAMARYRALF